MKTSNYLTRNKRRRENDEKVAVQTTVVDVERLRGPFRCFQLKTPEGDLYKTIGVPMENGKMFEFLRENRGKELMIEYQKIDARGTDWFMRLDGFLYHFGKLARVLGAKGDYGTPKRYLEIVKAETRENFEKRFIGMNI
jgi:hypothetical protein